MLKNETIDLYTNHVGVNANFYEINLVFGKEFGEENVDVDAIVRMSPQLAKVLLEVLDSTIHDYEYTFGEIKLPGKKPDKATKPMA